MTRRLELRNPWKGAWAVYLERAASTMEEARRLHVQGCPPGSVVVAGYQEQGRGRFSTRGWISPPGQGLLFTLVLDRRKPSPPSLLPLRCGLALALTLEREMGLKPSVKWPNDILVDGKKVAGILCESVGGVGDPIALVGVGVNCNQREFPPELEEKATSLRLLLGHRVRRISILEGFLHFLRECLEDRAWREKVLDRLFGLGMEIELHRGSEVLRGKLAGLAEDGALLLETEPGGGRPPIAVYSGEIHRP